MPSGCLRWRMASASWPSSGVGAWRYKWSASSGVTRSPARTRAAMASEFSIVEAQLAVEVHQTQFGGVTIERAQPFLFSSAKRVSNIIAQILLDDLLPCRVARNARGGNVRHVDHPLVPRPLQGRHILRIDEAG